MRALTRRLARLEAVDRAHQLLDDWPPALLIVRPATWPAADQAAFASGDAAARAAVVERHTGHPPGRSAVLFVVVPSREVER